MESVIVGAIILAAAAYAGYRLFAKPSCGCGDCGGCACSSSGPKKDSKNACAHQGCNCGK